MCTKSIIFINEDFEDFIDFAAETFLSTFPSDPSSAYKRFCPKLIIGLKCVTDRCWLLCCCGRCIKIEPWPSLAPRPTIGSLRVAMK